MGELYILGRKTMKFSLLFICSATCIALVGCFRITTGRGTIYYEAKTPGAVQALRSRIEPLRTALRSDERFHEEANTGSLDFNGVQKKEFDGCWIGYNRDEHDGNKDREAVLVVR